MSTVVGGPEVLPPGQPGVFLRPRRPETLDLGAGLAVLSVLPRPRVPDGDVVGVPVIREPCRRPLTVRGDRSRTHGLQSHLVRTLRINPPDRVPDVGWIVSGPPGGPVGGGKDAVPHTRHGRVENHESSRSYLPTREGEGSTPTGPLFGLERDGVNVRLGPPEFREGRVPLVGGVGGSGRRGLRPYRP